MALFFLTPCKRDIFGPLEYLTSPPLLCACVFCACVSIIFRRTNLWDRARVLVYFISLALNKAQS
jgi:hypothetical protein